MRALASQLKYAFYILTHPFDGFYDLKHEQRGSLKVALLLYALTALTALLRQQFSEYLFNPQADDGQNILTVVVLAVGPYLLWCVSNWCLTSLMDGEGGMKDMIIATGYALLPLIFVNLLYIGFSWALVEEEGHYILLLDGIGTLWTLLWVFFGMMVTQQYAFGKSVATAVLSIVGMGLILFVLLLLFYLAQQVYTFVFDLFTEIEFRVTA